jgi:uncharacterized protein YcnI
MFRKIVAVSLAAVLFAAADIGLASAHVVVKPSEVETAAFQSFTTGVPNEKELAVIKVRLVLPAGLKHVTPNVKPGWVIDETKEGVGEDAVVKEITWSGGQIPVGQRDDFAFSAQAPDKATTLQWKAYQIYADGTEVAWDQAPNSKADDDENGSTPYSETSVVDQMNTDQAASQTSSSNDKTRTSVAVALSVVALIMSVVALTKRR